LPRCDEPLGQGRVIDLLNEKQLVAGRANDHVGLIV
jgi:hypothetical protein